jgi:brefeldin A-resistance guanine nucleotide exchange factor 1
MAARLDEVSCESSLFLFVIVANVPFNATQPSDPDLSPTLADDVTRSKANKQVLLEGAAAFNLKPKVGIKFLEEHGVITKDPASLANFLKTTPKLDKKLLGDFISRPDQIEVLKSFMQSMDFSGVSFRLARTSCCC